MLIVDDNNLRLAKMQEALIRSSVSNREENLSNYKKTIFEIDKIAFSDILEEIGHLNEHNHSLEEEIEFLERIKNSYEQLNELQLHFRNVCMLCNDYNVILSDLSKLNIDSIEKRINVINGYLQNIKNIENNKKKVQSLNEQLVVELKKKKFIDDKLLELEKLLVDKFLSAEGRTLVDGKLQYVSVVSEYKKLNYDVELLLDNVDKIDVELSNVLNELDETGDKLKVAEISHNNIMTNDSKQILISIENDYMFIKYKVIMLKILKLLAVNNHEHDVCFNKRKKILELINSRLVCLSRLGVKFSIDPFNMIKINEQLNIIKSLADNSKFISSIEREISELTSRTERMQQQNDGEYLILLSDTKNLINVGVGLNDIDISLVDIEFSQEAEKEILDNQVISVKDISDKLNMHIINQKTTSVIKRVNQMMNGERNKQEGQDEIKEIEPELVIVQPKVTEKIHDDFNAMFNFDYVVTKEPEKNKEEKEEIKDIKTEFVFVEPEIENKAEDDFGAEFNFDYVLTGEVENKLADDEKHIETITLDDVKPMDNIFETITPFEEPMLFSDKVEEVSSDLDDMVENIDDVEDDSFEQVSDIEFIPEVDAVIDNSDDEELMPDAFWITQEKEEDVSVVNNDVISFDDQISALLSSSQSADSKIKKRVA